MFPVLSAASPAPDIQIAPCLPLGTTFSTLVWASVDASYPMIQPVYKPMSQCDAHPVYTTPFSNSSPARSLYCAGSKITLPLELLSPVPGKDAWTSLGP